jgi:hypothetical protein
MDMTLRLGVLGRLRAEHATLPASLICLVMSILIQRNEDH